MLRQVPIGAAALCLAHAALAPAPPAHAKGLDTNALIAMCETVDPAKPNNASECIAYLRGVYEGATFGFYLGTNKVLFCPAKPIAQSNELRATFLRYVQSHPSKTANDPAFVAIRAFTEAYPCQDNATQPPERP